jgi:hypothetical protein
VVFGTGALEDKAIAITDLDINGTLYDVAFAEIAPAVLVYGVFPGTFTFPTTNGDAQDAVLAVVGALSTAGALTVGEDTQLDTSLNSTFNVAYQSSGPTAALGVADYQTGSNAGGWAISAPGSSSWLVEERTWATFTLSP